MYVNILLSMSRLYNISVVLPLSLFAKFTGFSLLCIHIFGSTNISLRVRTRIRRYIYIEKCHMTKLDYTNISIQTQTHECAGQRKIKIYIRVKTGLDYILFCNIAMAVYRLILSSFQ